jgi:hypothetical protein
MMTEPKCVLWKRQGAEKIQQQIAGLAVSEELEFWRKHTEKLKAAQQKARLGYVKPKEAHLSESGFTGF